MHGMKLDELDVASRGLDTKLSTCGNRDKVDKSGLCALI